MTMPGTPENDDWPMIDGISPEIIREQIGGDARLFLRLLRKLASDFSDTRTMSTAADIGAIEGFGQRMHRLKGAAGSLGAMRIFDLAGLAETAAAAGDLAEFARLAGAVDAELDALRASLAEVKTLPAARAPSTSINQPDRDERGALDLDGLALLLRRQSFAALRSFDAVEAELHGLLGDDTVDALRDHIDHLRFQAAADLLERIARERR